MRATGWGVVLAMTVTLGAGASRGPAKDLAKVLAAKDAEIRQLKTRLAVVTEEEDLYSEAVSLGITEAVKASRLPDRQQRRIAIAIVREAQRNGLDPLLVVAVIRTESSFNNYASSHVGALGLMQVMPETGRFWAEKRGTKLADGKHLYDSELNIELGTSYLASLIKRFGSVEAALVAYNAGPSAARRILAQSDARKRFLAGYPKKVVAELARLKAGHESKVAQRSAKARPEG
jgi:soluble lytic murein transglycosylase